MNDYQPVDCGLHSRYELWIMHGRTLSLAWEDAQGHGHQVVAKPLDLVTRDGAEFLVLEPVAGAPQHLRLDRIRHAQPTD